MKSLMILAAIALPSGAATAQPVAKPQGEVQPVAAQRPVSDPLICEREEDTGTRLGSHKECHTRSEWNRLRWDDRNAIEKLQQQRPMEAK